MTEELKKEIEKDIELCRTFNDMWQSEVTFLKLKEKYTQMDNHFFDNFTISGKIAALGQPFDYLPELRALAEKLHMYLLTHSPSDDNSKIDSKSDVQTTNINIYGDVIHSDLSTNKNGDFNNNSSETPSDAKEEGRKNRRTQIIVAIIGAIATIACVIIPLLVNLFTKV